MEFLADLGEGGEDVQPMTDDNQDIVTAPSYEYRPLPSFAWAMEEENESNSSLSHSHSRRKNGYCYLCSVAPETNGKNPARDRIEQKLYSMAGKISSQMLCQAISDYHFLTVVKKTILDENRQEDFRWHPVMVHQHLLNHVKTDEKSHLIKQLWTLGDYDDTYIAHGCKIDTQTGKQVVPSFNDLKAHLAVLREQSRCYAQLRQLNKKDLASR